MASRATRVIVGRRSKYVVLLLWFVVLATVGALAGRLTDAEKNDSKSWLPGSAESTQVLDLQESFQSPNTLNAVVVYGRPTGLTPSDRVQIRANVARFMTLGTIDGTVTGPVFSADGSAASAVLPYDLGKDGWQQAGDLSDEMHAITDANSAGLAFHLTGTVGYAADSSKAFEGIDGTLLYAALAVVIVMLLLTYRSPVLWLLPVISAAAALLTAQGIIYVLAAHAGLTVNAQSAGILTVLVFGAGTDYALLLVARYREELRRHQDRHEAMAVALHRAGPAIFASAGTVTIGLLCLTFAETNATKGLGPVAAIGVVVALLSMVTLLPALLVTVGRWVFWPARPRYGSPEHLMTGSWARIGRFIAQQPRRVWVFTVLILGALGLATTTLDAHGLTNAQSFRGHPDSVVGEQVLARHFPAGAGSPVVVIANADKAAHVREVLAATPGIVYVPPPLTGHGKAFFQGVLAPAADSQAAYDVVRHVRGEVHAIPEADAKVGGDTAVNLDVQRSARHDRDLIIPLVLAVVFVILALLLRAILGPILLIGTVVLSYFAALGVSALAFDHVFGFGGADTSLPLFAFVFLVALGIDYNIFLMTRVREESLRHGTRNGALIGLAATGGVITAAGFVLAGTFAVLSTLPVVGFAEIGFAVAFGVLLDTLVVRSVLVTALNLDLGRLIWWPGPLWRQPDAPLDELDLEQPLGVS